MIFNSSLYNIMISKYMNTYGSICPRTFIVSDEEKDWTPFFSSIKCKCTEKDFELNFLYWYRNTLDFFH